jgi:hypothetical protein
VGREGVLGEENDHLKYFSQVWAPMMVDFVEILVLEKLPVTTAEMTRKEKMLGCFSVALCSILHLSWTFERIIKVN